MPVLDRFRSAPAQQRRAFGATVGPRPLARDGPVLVIRLLRLRASDPVSDRAVSSLKGSLAFFGHAPDARMCRMFFAQFCAHVLFWGDGLCSDSWIETADSVSLLLPLRFVLQPDRAILCRDSAEMPL